MLYINFTKKKYKAFTLAEVLITLGIIGVVAAMTIPTLMQNIQDRQFKEAAKAAYSKASQALEKLITDNGGWDDSLDYITFADQFISYFKTINATSPGHNYAPIDSYIVRSSTSSDYKTLYKNIQANTWQMVYQFITADGMFWTINWTDGTNPDLLYTTIIVDVNGYQKSPNIYGRDVFVFQVKNGKILPEGSNNTAYSASTYCNKTSTSSLNGFGCMTYVMQGIDY